MSHTLIMVDDQGRQWEAHHTGDWSGHVRISRLEGEKVKEEFRLPCAIVREIGVAAVQQDLIQIIEQWDGTAVCTRAAVEAMRRS